MKARYFIILSRTAAILLLVGLSVSSPLGTAVRAAPGDFQLISISTSGVQGNDYSRSADVSTDGRFVAFRSLASNLVAGDTNADEDIFLRDRQTGETTRISVSSSGAQGDGGSYYPAMTGDGRYIAFQSYATNLVSGDTNGFIDIFLRDRQTGTTTRLSVSSSGQQGNADSDSYLAISSDGRFIAFNSEASNLVSGDTNGVGDTFVRDRQTGTTERVSVDSNEVQTNGGSFYPAISADGRYVAFSSSATNLVAGDTNEVTDIFVRDRLLGLTTRVSVNSKGQQADHASIETALSADGRYVVFETDATNLLDEEAYGYPHVYVHDRLTGVTELQSISTDGYQLVGWAENPDISADGRYVTYEFNDKGDGMPYVAIYVHDRLTGVTTTESGYGLEDSSFGASLSGDGHYLAFSSSSTRLVSGDVNGVPDIFLRERIILSPTTTTYQSVGAYDGWVIESAEDSETGSRVDERANTFFLGDANNDQQYRSLLHFDTASLPNNAVITRAALKIKKQGIVGDNPFSTLGNILVDIRKPYFGTAMELQPSDFQANADQDAVGTVEQVPGAVWYTSDLPSPAFPSINVLGSTQFRLRFASGDNDNNDQDYIKFYSGDADPADRPVLEVEYYWTSDGFPKVVGIYRTDPDPTSAANVRYTVAFSETVTGVDVSDFLLMTTDGISGAAVGSVSGSGDTYTVTVGTGTGNGTIRLVLVDDDSILDQTMVALGGAGKNNGSYYGGQVYTTNKLFDKDTVGVFRPSNGVIFLKNTNQTGYADVALNYGIGGDYPVTGDWDGDGVDSIGVYRNGVFYLRYTNTVGYADIYFPFGSPGDQPIAGDWNGDGVDTIGVYNSKTITFYLRDSNSEGPADYVFRLGIPGDIGIAGDWTNKGFDTVGVFRPSNGVIFLKNTNQTGYADIAINYGQGGDKPVTGDWNNDGTDTIGILRGNTFYLRNSNTVGYADATFALGIPGDMPIAGNWDGLP